MEAQRILDQFVQERWLDLSPDGRYCIALRTLLELGPYLKDKYEEEIAECTLCMDLVTRGRRCPNGQCVVRLHHFCATRYFSELPSLAQVCLTCKTPWPNGVGKVFGVSLTREWGAEDYEEEEEEEGGMQEEEEGEEGTVVQGLPAADA